jgi:hypothetical protein
MSILRPTGVAGIAGAYVALCLIGLVLFPAISGITYGTVAIPQLMANPSVRAEISAIQDRELPKDEQRAAIKTVYEQHSGLINWAAVHLIINGATFAALGFLAGVWLRSVWWASILVFGMLPVTLSPLTNASMAGANRTVTLTIGIAAQLISVYLLAYLGKRIRTRRSA